VKEGAEFKYVTLDDRAEQTMLATYGERFSITRQAVINDDLDALKRLPKKFGGAARRTVGDLVFAILLGNPKMGDGVELFHASHGNLAPAGLINSATVDAGRVLMGTQKDGDVALNIRPAFLLTGISDESDATLTMTSDTEHRDDAKESRRKNAVRGLAKVLSDARLEEADAWFMSANHNVHDVIEVQYLDGDEKPRLEQQNGW
jgi:phage major head subunit gpT-like protein